MVLCERIGPLAVLLLLFEFSIINSEILAPPYFNLAEGKNISASATCGVDTEGPELFCKLIGGNSDAELTGDVIQGQYCDKCDPTKADKMHPPEFAVDGMETWWQSPPLSRGMKYNEVNLTIELGQEFHVAYVYIKMANSPRPGLWVLEKSADYGKSYTPWQYFSDSPADCETYFGRESLQPITRDDSVICSTEYSKIVPLEGGEIPISLLNKRPSANHYFNSTVLQEWTRATNVRLRFLRTKNLLGHLMSVARQDPTVTRRYFYSIKDISIGGRCMCNGHAEACDIPDKNDPRVLLCNCVHNTCGAKCNKCCSGFEQKAWRQSKHNDPFRCEACNCFQHSNDCIYDPQVDKEHKSLDIHGKYEGGGVCQNCQHNTEGINCHKCKERYYRPYHKHQNETDACQPCQCDYFAYTGNCKEGTGMCECRKEFTSPNCDSCSFGYYDYPNCKPCECYINGTASRQCQADNGECSCLPNFTGMFCKECADGYYNFPECKRCECDSDGAVSNTCEQSSGNCTCKNNFAGKQCNQCKDGYYDFPNCKYCHCDLSGTVEGVCDKENGKCICKEGYGGENCDICRLGYYGFPDCKPCNCSKIGSHGTTCTPTGKCSCLGNFSGRTCNQCSPGYFNYPDCTSCECDPNGSNGLSCDSEGICECHENFAGQRCDACREGYYNFPACEDCNCHPAGVVAKFAGCGSVPAGELCQCKERVEGRICDKCKPLFWNLHANNPNGCEECNCNPAGVLGGIAVCDTESGQCACKPAVGSRNCAVCDDGTYNLDERNLFGCTDCGCDIGGAINGVCNKTTGQCLCQTRVTGRTCREPIQTHYFPTLYQYQYEMEDGTTPESDRVRYANNDTVFGNYSWKGYAVFSLLQKEVRHRIQINKPSLYRMVFKYHNLNPHTVIGVISITSDNPTDAEQDLKVQFRNTSEPEFVTVSGESGNTPSPFVMNPGMWTINIKVNESVLIDYFVLLPEDFYSATILNQRVEKPCTLNETDLCRSFAYPNVTIFDKTYGSGGFTQNGENIGKLTEYFADENHLSKLNIGGKIPLLNDLQPEVSFNVSVQKIGQYVILINYITPLNGSQVNNIETEVQSKNGVEDGKLSLYSCPYTIMCRQVITNLYSGVGIYETQDNYILVKLKGPNAQVGVHSVIAVPLSDWSLDYIRPRPVCIRKDGKCINTSFRSPPDTKKIQFEQDVEGELGKNRPPVKESYDNSYIWLNPAENSVDLKGKVPNPGYYTFVVHYYQPDHSEFNLNVIIQNGQFYEAKIPIKHCPSVSGCRAIVEQNDRANKFSLTENFMITLKQDDGKNIYLDYLLVIPSDFYSELYLEEENFDRTGEFISTCGNNHFNIDTKKEGFCRNSVFSITAAHNSGASPCLCNFEGSLSFECEKFGGQCPCRPNIIGRQCVACKTGYYGFPDCKPCNCPSTAYCEPSTGQCICQKHVTGEKCDQCEPLTYGYDPIIGCEDCKCDILGVINNNRQCDLLNGSCPCKENVVGRTCDACKAGFYSFPYCDFCDCDTRGTTEEICDQASAACFCKKNVIGPLCDHCREGTFNLQADNEDGCSECFCFGKTTRCRSAEQLVPVPFIEMNGWHVVKINTDMKFNATELSLPIQEFQENVGAVFTNSDLNDTVAYFSAPADYLGKKLKSYGGFLSYKIFYVSGPTGHAVAGADVILKGENSFISHFSFEQPASNLDYSSSVQLIEANFQVSSGANAKREHIMEILNNLQGIYIRATYSNHSLTTRVSNVKLDEAVELEAPYQSIPEDQLMFVKTVEQCQCPPSYKGQSCEDCAPGYYRISSGPHGGYCVPCQCHGHANECDVNTGVCLNCTHHTSGDHCEKCEIGYHGNAVAGTPYDCLICACPSPTASNNFAVSCDVSSDGNKISCECKEGYFGARCQSCAAGYYGRPENAGDFCKPCQCSGNINPNDPRSCDTETGECLHCLNNTSGEACALCAPGYFGDAIKLKDCQACICDELGTDHCDSFTGKCVCKQNVIGDKCDRCEIEHYGFQTGQGCTPCQCSDASISDQCEDLTGQCLCKDGAGGRQCERCASGYWNYTTEGCVSCGCKSEYSLGFGCNTLTGQCECLQGVVGEKCDQCPHRWAFVPEFGCHQCDNCIHALLDDTDQLDALIEPHITYFDSAQSGYFTRRRLANMRDWVTKLEPKFDDVDPKQVSLTESIQELESLEQDSKNLNRKSNYKLQDTVDLNNKSIDLDHKAQELQDIMDDAIDKYDQVVHDIGSLQFTDNTHGIDESLELSQKYLNEIKDYNFTDKEVDGTKQLNKVNELLNNLTRIKEPVDSQVTRVENLKNDLKNFTDKLDDLFNQTQYSRNVAHEAKNTMEKSGKDLLKNKLQNIENEVSKSENNIKDAKENNEKTKELLEIATGKLKDLFELPEQLTTRNNDFNSTLENNNAELQEVHAMQHDVEVHAEVLTTRAQELDRLVSDSRIGSTDAIKAARAYQDIVKAVKDGRNAVESAENDTINALDIQNDVTNRSFEASDQSEKSLERAQKLYWATKKDLEPKVNQTTANYAPLKQAHDDNEGLLKDIQKKLEKIELKELDAAYEEAALNADVATNYVNDIASSVNKTFKQLANQTEDAKALPKGLEDMRSNIQQTEKQLVSVNEQLPPLIEAINEIPKEQEALKEVAAGMQTNINKLNQQIALARDIANRIKIGVQFYPNTTLELRNPSNLEDLTTSTKISGYFRTNKPKGLIMYLGNPVGTNLRKTKTDDYMALDLQNGYPVLHLDVGNGHDSVVSTKYVADNNWYQYIIERVGHNAKLTIREQLPNGEERSLVSEKALETPYTIFNLDKDKSKLFVGGSPPNSNLQNEIDTDTFEGEIEDLVIGDTPVSLWNFNNGHENNHGAVERDKLVILQPSTGFRFNGDGYTILDARTRSLRSRSSIQLAFKSFATEGLLFLTGEGKTFIALELRNGKVLYQYNLGSGTKVFVTSKPYNDGLWHKVTAERDGPKGYLVVDNENVADRTAPIGGTSLEPVQAMFFGGYPYRHNFTDVTEIKFDGCINNVTITGETIDLRDNLKAYDVTPGCPSKFATMVSFNKHQPGYVAWDRLSISNDFKLSLKFKTKEKDGLIFYATDIEQSAGISLSISNGYLKVISQKTELVSKDTFNDSQWHVVSVIHNQDMLRADFDDWGFRVTDNPPPLLHILYANLYVGGVPRNLKVLRGTVGSEKPFFGCIADLTVNGNVKNFANTTDRRREILDRCTLDVVVKEEVPDVHRVPDLKPLEELSPSYNKHDIVTHSPPKQDLPSRGDGGLDFNYDKNNEIVGKNDASRVTEGIIGRPPPTTPKPVVEGCALPLVPGPEDHSQGFRFGTQDYSHLEYTNGRGRYRKNFDYSLQIKTNSTEGLIFYISNKKEEATQFIALYLSEGFVVFKYQGNSSLELTSDMKCNSGDWCDISFSREDVNVKLVVNDVTYGSDLERHTTIELQMPFYIGGVNNMTEEEVSLVLGTPYVGFVGCIRHFHMNNKPMDQPNKFGVISCSKNVEIGTYLSGDVTHMKLLKAYKIGLLFDIKLDIKPRVDTGLIIASFGKKDYLILEMVHGTMKLTVENGKGPVTTSYKPPNRYYFCDGNWHSIQAVKSKNVITLAVDNVFTDPKIGDRSAQSTDTGSALLLGGHKMIRKLRGSVSKSPYIGCVRNVIVNNEHIPLTSDLAEGNVTYGYCRTD